MVSLGGSVVVLSRGHGICGLSVVRGGMKFDDYSWGCLYLLIGRGCDEDWWSVFD